MEMGLTGKRVAVFGAARGIGRAIAEGFLAEGARVTGFDRDAKIEPLREAGDIVSGDVADCASVEAFAGGFDAVDHVVFSVGAGSGKFGFPFWNLEPGDWARVIEINLIGAVNAAHAFAPKLIQQPGASILFLVSVAGQMGSQTDPPYSAAKAGLINFMQCVAKDLAVDGIRANAMSPGMVKTSLNRSVWEASGVDESYEDWAEGKIKNIAPLGQWQNPEEFGAMAVYLASPQAKNITGQTINIDGGQVMHS